MNSDESIEFRELSGLDELDTQLKLYQMGIESFSQNYLKKMKRGGLGLYLIKTLMDKVDYHIKPGVRNEVKMIKYIV